ncbi:Hydroperoxy fatty acid reductase gpx1 [invertebrate metagenome]|uniref:Hydroperoxy fatty acid reductase gpx1 n=1 Tax=invertebrate metagenome TaxID=1711999 RepID=A0A2H9T5Y2_9ZZZZ
MKLEQYQMPLLDGSVQSLGAYSDKLVMIVNTASRCGFTPQYKGLEALYQKYKDEGFVILGFPSNQFLHQEPGTSEEIAAFCEKNYGVTFPMFQKINVNGDNAASLFKDLEKAAPGMLGSKNIKWNFTKFLISPVSKKIKRYAPSTKPSSIDLDIRLALKRIQRKKATHQAA